MIVPYLMPNRKYFFQPHDNRWIQKPQLRGGRSRFYVVCELVPGAAHGVYVVGFLGVGFDFLADMLDVHDCRMSIAKVRSVPELLPDLLAAEDSSRVRRE